MAIILSNLNRLKSFTGRFLGKFGVKCTLAIATYARCGGIFNIHLTANLPRNLPVIFFKSVKICKNYDHGSVGPLLGRP